MSESSEHLETAIRIATIYGVEYNNGKGVDIEAPGIAIEVETPETVRDGIEQLQGYRCEVYIAGTNKQAVLLALRETANTTVGVMDQDGTIVKRSTRHG